MVQPVGRGQRLRPRRRVSPARWVADDAVVLPREVRQHVGLRRRVAARLRRGRDLGERPLRRVPRGPLARERRRPEAQAHDRQVQAVHQAPPPPAVLVPGPLRGERWEALPEAEGQRHHAGKVPAVKQDGRLRPRPRG